MNNHVFPFMNDGILWMDILHFVLLGFLPIDLHLYLPFLVHLYPSYISIQWSLTAVLELFTNRDFDPALPGCQQKCISPLSPHSNTAWAHLPTLALPFSAAVGLPQPTLRSDKLQHIPSGTTLLWTKPQPCWPCHLQAARLAHSVQRGHHWGTPYLLAIFQWAPFKRL